MGDSPSIEWKPADYNRTIGINNCKHVTELQAE